VHLDTLAQLFNSMDPSPFYQKDLDADAEQYIMSWAEEFPLDEPVSLMLHLEGPVDADAQGLVTEAVHDHFYNQARLARLEFRRLMRNGWRSLLIGLTTLALAVTLSEFLRRSDGAFAEVGRECLLIGGWVAMWRPMQIYLYEWWPLQRRWRIFNKLSHMKVGIRTRATASAAIGPRPDSPSVDKAGSRSDAGRQAS
jgi:hypothetical protein